MATPTDTKELAFLKRSYVSGRIFIFCKSRHLLGFFLYDDMGTMAAGNRLLNVIAGVLSEIAVLFENRNKEVGNFLPVLEFIPLNYFQR